VADEETAPSGKKKLLVKDGPIHPTSAKTPRQVGWLFLVLYIHTMARRNLYMIDYKKEHPKALKSEFAKAWGSLDEETLAAGPSFHSQSSS